MRKFIVGPNPSPHDHPEDEAVTIENYPHDQSNYCQVWAMSDRDVLKLYHELGNYLLWKNGNGEATGS